MVAAAQPVSDTPHIPAPDRLRLRMRLIAEEVLELFDEVYMPHEQELTALHEAFQTILFRDPGTINANVAMIADALADIDYVVEGMRQEAGINGIRIAEEVHRANMAKFAEGSYRREDGKQMKPPDWQPPNIQGVLNTQNELARPPKHPGRCYSYCVRGFDVHVVPGFKPDPVCVLVDLNNSVRSPHRDLLKSIIDTLTSPVDRIEVHQHMIVVINKGTNYCAPPCDIYWVDA